MIALHDIPVLKGSVIVAPASHVEPFILTQEDKAAAEGSIQHSVPKQLVDKYSELSVPLARGDVIIAHMHLFHKSGVNESGMFRFSAIARYHTITSDDYIASRGPKQWNQYDLEKFKALGDKLLDL